MTAFFKKKLAGWGNFPVAECLLTRPERFQQLKLSEPFSIARGLGRSYGDAALNSEGAVIGMERLNRFLSFDESTGIVQLEAGVSLEEILDVFVPKGWFLPVTPGTKFVTVGGCIASDVHGKNHHRDGNFSASVTVIDLLTADGVTKRCSPTQNPSLFWATIGGMGLTGVITQAALKLIPIHSAYIHARHYPARNLEELLELLDSKSNEEKYSVAWLDCLATGESQGRGVLMLGRHAEPDECPSRIKDPLQLRIKSPSNIASLVPSWLLNKWSVSLFNQLYHSVQTRKKDPFITDYNSYFYPLDRIANWNKLYGKKGFIQYQFVVPLQTTKVALKEVLDFLKERGLPSYLAVLKRFGKQGPGLLSFPFEGYTLTLDIPIGRATLFSDLDDLDEIVLKNEGRVYLAKDGRLNSDRFRKMYPRLGEWLTVKKEVDPNNRFSSDMARRLKLEVNG